jgi:uncharacterized protein (UPF0548 family)
VILVRRPAGTFIEQYRLERMDVPTTCSPTSEPLNGFHRDNVGITLGQGDEAFERARGGLQDWEAHRGAGVEVFPTRADIREGEVVAILTRQLGLWVLAACRIESTIDNESTFGFTYATLPDHPERGYESFTIRRQGDDVTFEINAASRPGIPLVRLGAPVTRILQKRTTRAYLDALKDWTEAG